MIKIRVNKDNKTAIIRNPQKFDGYAVIKDKLIKTGLTLSAAYSIYNGLQKQ